MADDWRQPSRTQAGTRFLRKRAREQETWETRLAALFIAIPVFELALVAGVVVASGGSTGLALDLYGALPLTLHLALCCAALGVAAVWGMSGVTWLLGHLFWTHDAPDQSKKTTVALWVALVVSSAALMLWFRL